MRQQYMMILMLGVSAMLTACHDATFAEYEDPSKPYNRKEICAKLTEILREYDSPNDYVNKPITRKELAKYYKDYKTYGCEK